MPYAFLSQGNFNPRTREGCDGVKAFCHFFFQEISIHAPVKGATLFSECLNKLMFYFNPRTREGCDVIFIGNTVADALFQSTHP